MIIAIGFQVLRIGLATRAAATNEKGTVLLGYNPVDVGHRQTGCSHRAWSAASGILLTPLAGVNPFNYSLMVIPALGAALAGQLRLIGRAVFAGLLIGGFQAYAVHLVAQKKVPEFFFGGIDSLVPFIVIVTALVLAGHTLPTRGTFLDRRYTDAPLPNMHPLLWAFTVATGVALALTGDAPLRFGLIQSLYVMIVLLSIVVITGFVGQMSMAQLALAGFSGFTLSRLTDGYGLPFPFAPVLAIAITVAVGVLIAIPALRIRGIQFAIVTYSAALVFERLIFRSPSFTGGGGLAPIEQPTLLGIDLGIFAGGSFPSRRFAVIAVFVTAALCWIVGRLRSGSTGRRFLAVRINERAAAAAGINITRTKLAGRCVLLRVGRHRRRHVRLQEQQHHERKL